MDQPVSSASSVSIEPLRSGHAALLFDVLSSDAVYDFIDERKPESVEQLEQRHAFMLDPDSAPANQRWLNWLVIETADDPAVGRQVIGTVQATIDLERQSALVAYILAPNRWGRGLACQAVELLLAELDDSHHVNVAQAYIAPDNQRSIALIERLGFAVAAASPDDDGNLIYERTISRST